MAKHCQYRDGCKAAPVPTERYCPAHRKLMLREMRESGYLQPLPHEEACAEPHGKPNEREAQAS